MDVGECNPSDEFVDESEIISDDEITIDSLPTKTEESLMPDDVEDEVVGVMCFADEFRSRYGRHTPLFYQGSLSDAFEDSVWLPEKKLLAMYLHHDGSTYSKTFISRVMCNGCVVEYLTANFVVWGWDLTNEPNKARLVNLIAALCGNDASNTVENLYQKKMPALLVITDTYGYIRILSIIHGHSNVDEAMDILMKAESMI